MAVNEPRLPNFARRDWGEEDKEVPEEEQQQLVDVFCKEMEEDNRKKTLYL